MQKTIISAMVYVLAVLIIFYAPLSFGALSFNPTKWSNLERGILAWAVWFAILIAVGGNFKKQYDKFKI